MLDLFQGKKILLGVTAGIAAYKAAELLRLLVKAGATVRVVMTSAATHFVAPLTFEALSNHPVHTALFSKGAESSMAHIDLSRWADLCLIAPATADFIAKMSLGLADDLLSNLCLAATCPLIVLPAMNRYMWEAAATQGHIATLQARGIEIWGPAQGEQACGEIGFGRLIEPAEIMQHLIAYFKQQQRLVGLSVVITAGPTREAIDPVRFISNYSSGKMGYALAAAFAAQGAQVSLISGPVALSLPPQLRCIHVETAEQMLSAVQQQIATAAIFISTAAVVDYRVAQIATQKIKKSTDKLTLNLQKNPDILTQIAAAYSDCFLVGFAAETENVIENAQKKLIQKKVNLMIANEVAGLNQGFEADENAVTVLFQAGEPLVLPSMPKLQLAEKLMAIILNEREKNLCNKSI